ncbi:MAG TPA: hypothetical protein DCY20_00205 [Firmicutes bacterium]|nr:hypothetical protein [Bacillota bacterium]
MNEVSVVERKYYYNSPSKYKKSKHHLVLPPKIMLKENDIVMLYDQYNKLIEYPLLENKDNISIIFKVKGVQHDSIVFYVMEIIYPVPLFSSQSNVIDNLMLALINRMAVIKNTGKLLKLNCELIRRSTKIDIVEISEINTLLVTRENLVCPPMKAIESRITCTNPNEGVLSYNLLTCPLYGKLALDTLSGQWTYENETGIMLSDAFTVIIWDSLGGWVSQKVIIKIYEDSTPFFNVYQAYNDGVSTLIFGESYETGEVQELGGFIKNNGNEVVHLVIQYSPDNINYVDEKITYSINPGEMLFYTPMCFTPFTRIKIESTGVESVNVETWQYAHMEF